MVTIHLVHYSSKLEQNHNYRKFILKSFKKDKISYKALRLNITLENIIVHKAMMLDFCLVSEHDMKLYTKLEGLPSYLNSFNGDYNR